MTYPLHERAKKLAGEFRKLEAELTEVLRQIDESKLYRILGCASLFEYATKELGLTESVAYGFIAVARKSKEIPELKKAIDTGAISVSQAKRVTSVLTSGNASDLIAKAQTLTQRELEKEVAKINPKGATRDQSRYVTESRVEVRFGASEGFMKKLKEVQDLVSKRMSGTVGYEEAFEAMLDVYLEKYDPVRKAKRSEMRSGARETQETRKPSLRKVRDLISARLRHRISLRDQGRCTYVSKTGTRCESSRWLEIHHKKPVSHGGENSETNLITLCSGHHKVVHQSSSHGA